jgi:hypothetical protein
MPGVAQFWFTAEEVDALLRAAFDTKVKVSSRLEPAIRDKLLAGFAGIACKPAVALHESEPDQSYSGQNSTLR